MPLKVICSCGAMQEYSEALRGVEVNCNACGRIYRLPFGGDTLDLSRPRGDNVDASELERLVSITPNAKQAGLFERRTSRWKLILSLLVLLGLVAGLVWWLAA